MSESDKGVEVQMFKLKNRLVKKLGMKHKDGQAGEIDPEAIAEADKLIAKLCKECPATISGYQDDLSEYWKEMRDMPEGKDRDAISEKVFTTAHEIKDLGAMCGLDLPAYFAESLRDFIGQTKLNLDAQRVIIQAHIDALQVVVKQNIKEGDSAVADELKAMVKIA